MTHPLLPSFRAARRLKGRVSRLFQEELGGLQPSKLCAEAATLALPHLSFNYLRTLIWRAAGLRLGERARIMGALHITGRASWRENLQIGSDTFITGPVQMDLAAPIEIGERVRIGHHVMLLTVDHEIGSSEQRCAATRAFPIKIGDGAWLASRVVVLPGVSIGKGAVVAAGAVVTRDVPDDTLVAGVPARVVRHLDEAAPESDDFRLRAQAKAEALRSPLLRAPSSRPRKSARTLG